MTPREEALQAIKDVRQAVGIVALLQAGDELTRADMKAAVNVVDGALDRLVEFCRQATAPAPFSATALPILTLAEVAARAKHRAAPHLRLVTNEGDAA